MKYIIIILSYYLSHSLCFAQLEFEEINKRDVVSKSIMQYDFTFKFKNIGNVPIKILSVDTTCGCTIASTNNTLIPPKERGYIKGTLKLSEDNNQVKNIIVNTDYLPQKSIILSLNINKITPLQISPRLLFWKKDSKATEKTVTIKIRNPNTIISRLSYNDTLIRVTKEDKSTKSNEVLLNIVPIQLTKNLRTRIALHITDNLDKSTTQFYIYILVK
jgi:hypothetical protein